VAAGVLAGLARWPVKSLGGEQLDAARLDWRGVGGDRAHALLDVREGREGRWLTARQAPGLLAWSAAYPDAPGDRLDPADPPPPTLRAPDGTAWGWDAPGLEAALADHLGLALAHPCARCVIPARDPDDLSRWPELLRWLHRHRRALFGVNATVVAGGVVRVGDRVTVEEPAVPAAARPATDWDAAPRGMS
jgi:uncharacterized protein YcbX